MDSASLAGATRTQIWLHHARSVLLLFAVAACLFATTHLDLVIARSLFFDGSSAGWIGADSWLVNEAIHTGGRWAVRGVACLALTLWIASFLFASLRNWRRPAGYFLCAIVLTIGGVGLLKAVTNVDCPWDLSDFGGQFPHVDLFAPRPDGLPRARCFPAAHASSGYAFTALYFLAHERSRTLARIGLAIGLLLGLIFGVAQQSRGAHFLSHDLWSAFLAWMVPLTLYTFAFDGHLYARRRRSVLHCSQALESPSCRLALLALRRPRNSSWACRSEKCSITCVRRG
jgi:membrane-associated PAP2 superfamily phosphatase